MESRFSHRSWTLIGAVLLAITFGGSRPAIAEDEAELDRRIAQLINQLGDNEYVVRQRAQQELSRLGFSAFDALTDAEENEDVEIATQSRYLARQIRSEWIDQTVVAPQVREILKDYDAKNDATRAKVMEQLLKLPEDAGIESLCRLLRFEHSPVLAKQVAILIITQDPQPDDANWPRRAAMLTKNLGRSRRPAALWLTAYVVMRTDPEKALASWIELVNAEKRTLEQHPQQTDSDVVMKLLRIEVAQLQQLNREEDALAAMREMVTLERGDSQTLAALVGWLAMRHAWSVIDEVATRFAACFEADPQLLYTLAQALAAEGKTDQAQEAADRALRLNPDRAFDHLALGFLLQRKSLNDWSDREFRHVIDLKNPPIEIQLNALQARLALAESLHDRMRDGEAGEILQGALDLLDSNPELAGRAVSDLLFKMEPCRAQALLYQANACGQKHDFAKQRELLEKAIQEDSANSDILIGLYRLPDQTTEQRQKTLDLIAGSVQLYRNQIDEDSDQSTPYNQLAWLVANTEGDFDDAVRLSEKSVELERVGLAHEPQKHGPGVLGGHLDTLAHCYAAKGDYAAAVKAQTEASQLIPWSHEIARKLAFFRSKLPESEQKDLP